MQSNETKILIYLLKVDEIQDSKAKGIALSAIDKGYDSLTPAQKSVLEPFFNPDCEGDVVNRDCSNTVSNEDFVKSIEDYAFLEKISCRRCLEQAEHQEYTWNRMSKE